MLINKQGQDVDGLDKVLDKIYRLKNGEYWVEIKRNRPSRSNLQNRYYWGCVLDILSNETGFTHEEMHELMARKFLSYEKQGVMFAKSTTSLNTVEFEEYLASIRHFASVDLGCFIPLPNENYEWEYK